MSLHTRKWINQLIRPTGYEFAKLKGSDLFYDIRRFLPRNRSQMIFDVGANEGQTVCKFKKEFPHSTIHSFEPGPTAFEELRKTVLGLETTFIWNVALASQAGQRVLLENTCSTLSSFLPIGSQGWGAIAKEVKVDVTTVDQFCAAHQITHIDLLKSDTQGYDLEVLRGAESLLNKEAISLVYCEVNFAEIYKHLPSFEELFRYLAGYGFRLEAFYELHRLKNAPVAWTDALFVHKKHL